MRSRGLCGAGMRSIMICLGGGVGGGIIFSIIVGYLATTGWEGGRSLFKSILLIHN